MLSAVKRCLSRAPWPIWLGAGLTIAWLGGLVVFWTLLYKEKSFWKLDLNEVGDLLAGVSAPVAFLWLFVAVLLQMIELGLQREELRRSRRALQASAAEQKALVEQTKQSAQVSRETLERQQHADAEERLHKLLDTVGQGIIRVSGEWRLLSDGRPVALFGDAKSAKSIDDVFFLAAQGAHEFPSHASEEMHAKPKRSISLSVDYMRLINIASHVRDVIDRAEKNYYETVLVRIELVGLNELLTALDAVAPVVNQLLEDIPKR